MDTMWKKWNEVKLICQNKRIVLFGRSEDWVHKTLPKLSRPPDYIIDSNPGYTGTTFHNLNIYPPDKLKTENIDEIYIIITAGPYESVVSQLEEYNLQAGKHFCCTPAYYDFKLLQEIHRYDRRILISSPDYSEKKNHRYSKSGGGLYICDLISNQIEKKIPGHFRQVMQVDGYIYALEYVEMKLYVLSMDINIVEKLPLDKPNVCGLAYCPERKLIFISNTGTDTISIYNKEKFRLVDTIEFSDKYRKRKIGRHHINDICVVEDSLYVSYFSLSGNWKRGILDGGIVEFHIDQIGKPANVLVKNLWMPHSVEFFDGKLTYLDSRRGRFYIGNQNIAGEFPGFMRGLDYDGRFYYIGQSEDMYMSDLFGISNNIMLNAGFFLFDVDTKVSKFYSFKDLINVHDILVLP